MEKDEVVKELREKLVVAERLATWHESQNTELLAKREQETLEMESNRAKLQSTGISLGILFINLL